MTEQGKGLLLDTLIQKVQTMAADLAALRVELERLRATIPPPKTGADLQGMLEGLCDITDEDLENAKYRFEWEGEIVGGPES